MTQTVSYRRRHNFSDADQSVAVEQRWPVTRSRAVRAAVDDTLAAYLPGNRAYQWVRVSASGGSGPSAPVLDMDDASTESTITITWTQDAVPDSTEVWRSIDDGATFALLDTVTGATTTFVDPDTIPLGLAFCYKLRSTTAAGTSPFSNIVCILNDYTVPDTGIVDKPDWLLALDNLTLPDATGFLVPNLREITGNLFASLLSGLLAVDFSSLALVGQDLILAGSGLTALSLPALTSCGSIDCTGCIALASFSAPLLTYLDGKTYSFNGAALDVTSVEGILIQAVASGVTSATFDLSGGSNAGVGALSPAGNLAYNQLVNDGNTVFINA